MHPHSMVSFINSTKGSGVFATAFIPKGTVVFVVDFLDIKIPLNDPMLRKRHYAEHIERYGYKTLEDGYVIGWDHSKFVNHSCSPNTISTGWGFEIAIRDIQEGEEIVDEYGLLNIEHAFDCCCGSESCRKQISPTDYSDMYPIWDNWVKEAIVLFDSVNQPLLKYFDEETIKKVRNYLLTGEDYQSVTNNIIPAIYLQERRFQGIGLR